MGMNWVRGWLYAEVLAQGGEPPFQCTTLFPIEKGCGAGEKEGLKKHPGEDPGKGGKNVG